MSYLRPWSWEVAYTWFNKQVAGEHYLPYYANIYVSVSGTFFLTAFFATLLFLPMRMVRLLGCIDCYRRQKSGCYIQKRSKVKRFLCRANNRLWRCAEILLGATSVICTGVLVFLTAVFGRVPIWVTIPTMLIGWTIVWFHFIRVRDVEGVGKNRYGNKLGDRFGVYFDEYDEEEEPEEEMNEKDDKKKLSSKSNISSARQELEPQESGLRVVVRKMCSYFGQSIKNYPWGLWYGLKKRWWLLILGVIPIVLSVVLMNVFSCNVCVAYQPFESSTTVSRVANPWRNCEWDTICHHYLTVPEDLSTSVIVNFLLYSYIPVTSQVLYSTATFEPATVKEENVKFKSVICERLSQIADEQRYQCSVALTGLLPNSTYFIASRVKNTKTIVTPLLKFRTSVALNSNEPVRFISAGDWTWLTNEGEALGKSAASMEPMFAMVTGDFGNDSGNKWCYRRWDVFLKKWSQNMVTPTGYTIPLLTVAGNNEAGGFYRKDYDIPFYSQYFPHDSKLSSNRMYHAHTFASHTVIVGLDANVVNGADSQKLFISNTFTNNQGCRNKFAFYHGAMYPCRTPESYMIAVNDNLRYSWQDTFDTFAVTAAFESHYGCYKITKPIKKDAVAADNKGTIYLGDGSVGMLSDLFDNNSKFQYAGAYDHYYVVDAASASTTITSFAYKDGNVAQLHRITV